MNLRLIKHIILWIILGLFTASTLLFVLFIVFYFFIQGLRYFHISMLWTNFNTKDPSHGGMGPFIITSLMLLVLSMSICTPICLFMAIYLTEFCDKKNISNTLKLILNIMNSMPSILFGILGMTIFVLTFHLGYTGFSILAGSLTLALIVIPNLTLSMISSIEKVPKKVKNSAYALGSTKFEVMKNIILPQSSRHMVGGFIICISRILGESAPVYLTIGASVYLPSGFLSQGRSLVTCIYLLFTDGSTHSATEFIYCVAMVVMLIILILNLFGRYLLKEKKYNSFGEKITIFKKISKFFNKIKVKEKNAIQK